jgi:hypothetical protein
VDEAAEEDCEYVSVVRVCFACWNPTCGVGIALAIKIGNARGILLFIAVKCFWNAIVHHQRNPSTKQNKKSRNSVATYQMQSWDRQDKNDGGKAKQK